MRAVLAYHATQNGASSFVDYMCVDRAYRRGGIGRAMLANIDTPIYLITACLRPSRNFYSRCGFVECFDGPYDPGFGEQCLHAATLNCTRMGTLYSWESMDGSMRDDLISIVKRNERVGNAVARRLLGVEDHRVRFIVVEEDRE